MSGRCLSEVVPDKKKTLCIIYVLFTRSAHTEFGEKRDRERENGATNRKEQHETAFLSALWIKKTK